MIPAFAPSNLAVTSCHLEAPQSLLKGSVAPCLTAGAIGMAPRAFTTIPPPPPPVFLGVSNFPSTSTTTQPPPLEPPVLCISFVGAGMEPSRGGGPAVLPPGEGLLSSTPSLMPEPPCTHTHTGTGTGPLAGRCFTADRSHNHPHAPNKRSILHLSVPFSPCLWGPPGAKPGAGRGPFKGWGQGVAGETGRRPGAPGSGRGPGGRAGGRRGWAGCHCPQGHAWGRHRCLGEPRRPSPAGPAAEPRARHGAPPGERTGGPGPGRHRRRVPEPHRCVPLPPPVPPHRARGMCTGPGGSRTDSEGWSGISGEGLGPVCRAGMETGRGTGQGRQPLWEGVIRVTISWRSLSLCCGHHPSGQG